MLTELIIYTSRHYDGLIHCRSASVADALYYDFTLLRDNQIILDCRSERHYAQFTGFSNGAFHARVCVTLKDGSTRTFESAPISVGPIVAQSNFLPLPASFKGNHTLFDNVPHYYLELRLDGDKLDLLNQEGASRLPLYERYRTQLSFVPVFTSAVTNQPAFSRFRYLYRTEGTDVLPLTPPELISIATELETLDFVVYCSVTPDMRHAAMEDIQLLQKNSVSLSTAGETPDFSHAQKYLEDVGRQKGMNVRRVWEEMGIDGLGVSTHHLDSGCYPDHEDLTNVTVVSNGSQNPDHGTASIACIGATNNGFGVTGIAYNSQCFSYSGGLDNIIERALPGDIVSASIGVAINGQPFPLTASKSWWDKFHALSEAGVVSVISAGNSNLDLGDPTVMTDYGDSGCTLVGACSPSGGRLSFSNYGHPTNLYNSWGDGVVTAGFGAMWDDPESPHLHSYTFGFNGTSSAAPLCAGALALVQSEAFSLGNYLNYSEMRELIIATGFDDDVKSGIGTRPDVYAACANLRLLDELPGPVIREAEGGIISLNSFTGPFAHADITHAGLYAREKITLSYGNPAAGYYELNHSVTPDEEVAGMVTLNIPVTDLYSISASGVPLVMFTSTVGGKSSDTVATLEPLTLPPVLPPPVVIESDGLTIAPDIDSAHIEVRYFGLSESDTTTLTWQSTDASGTITGELSGVLTSIAEDSIAFMIFGDPLLSSFPGGTARVFYEVNGRRSGELVLSIGSGAIAMSVPSAPHPWNTVTDLNQNLLIQIQVNRASLRAGDTLMLDCRGFDAESSVTALPPLSLVLTDSDIAQDILSLELDHLVYLLPFAGGGFMLNATLYRGNVRFQQSGIRGYLITPENNAQFAVVYEANANTLTLGELDEIHTLTLTAERHDIVNFEIDALGELYSINGAAFIFEYFHGPVFTFKTKDLLPGELKMTPFVNKVPFETEYGPTAVYQVMS
ncbi:S8 family serine peptidase [Enterobacter kobei]|uniref:S8 family serine peptidase n=1 Tax=Enterobacter kobei TaxID=208224 RepID=UPI003CFAACE7